MIQLALLIFAHQAFAASPPPYACALVEPIFFGASVTANYNGIPDGAAGRIARAHDQNYIGSNLNPVAQMQKELFGEMNPTNLSEMVGGGKYAGNGEAELSGFIQSAEGKKKFATATSLVSLDAFYWPSAMKKNCDEVVASAETLIQLAKKNRKPLVLANLPVEDPNRVSILLKKAGWIAPPKACVAKVNAKIASSCSPADQCYTLDLFTIVKDLNAKGAVIKGKKYRPEDIRFDGVHMSETGRGYLMDLIAKKFLANPPACSTDPKQQKRVAYELERAKRRAQDAEEAYLNRPGLSAE